VVHLYDAHFPYDPPAEFRKQYPQDPYDAESHSRISKWVACWMRQTEISRWKDADCLLSDHGEGWAITANTITECFSMIPPFASPGSWRARECPQVFTCSQQERAKSIAADRA